MKRDRKKEHINWINKNRLDQIPNNPAARVPSSSSPGEHQIFHMYFTITSNIQTAHNTKIPKITGTNVLVSAQSVPCMKRNWWQAHSVLT
mmetsp:Transcript_25964/g.42811  ORF Transcript_25964/g.42811 Transcript_25964/m.42811 type:complete len:90 (-) Transcript_25964:179-448(-)